MDFNFIKNDLFNKSLSSIENNTDGCQAPSKALYFKEMDSWLKKYPAGSVVEKAYEFAKEAHKDVRRASGDPYITHSLAVAETVHEWKLDNSSIAAALLHDVLEDTNITTKDIEKDFGDEIAFLVNGLTKLCNFQYPTQDPNVENLRKLIISFSKDLRVVIIKLADRLHNMQTLAALPVEDQKRIALETNDIYAPLAYRLGMQKLSGELEDLAFPHLYPQEYEWLLKTVRDRFAEREAYVQKIKPMVFKTLNENNIRPVEIDGRAKRYSSLYKKLIRYDMNLDKVYDLVALRIVVKTVEDCYATLGTIHKTWAPLPGRIKDYIARPKPNGYRSLHTTVFCLGNKITEIQIRTKEMHDEAELGIAAHWAYEQIKSSAEHRANWLGVRQRKELLWVEQLRNWQNSFTDQKKFVDALKIEFFKDRIFIITPHNDVLDLPAGATPVDFAYRIHSEIGNQCVGAKVNGQIVPLDYELQSGDVVEILTQRGKKPSRDWLRFIKTSLAANYIKNAIRAKEKTLKRTIPSILEFKIVNRDRPGYLKDVTTAFSELKINIISFTGQTDHRRTFSNVIIKCDSLEKQKLEKLLVKLKKIPDTKEVNYKILR